MGIGRRSAVALSAVSKAQDTECSSEAVIGRRGALALAGVACLPLAAAPPAQAGLDSYNITSLPIEEVSVSLGNSAGALVFEPSVIELTAGRLTKLKFSNPSTATHYFTALEFADKIYTVLVLAGQPATEVKGKVQEVALKAGASATWVMIPIKPGKYPLKCTVKGHSEGGMVGTIIVNPPAAAITASSK